MFFRKNERSAELLDNALSPALFLSLLCLNVSVCDNNKLREHTCYGYLGTAN